MLADASTHKIVGAQVIAGEDVNGRINRLSAAINKGMTVEEFLSDWTRLSDRVDEVGTGLNIAKDVNTADKEAEQRFNRYLDRALVLPTMGHPAGLAFFAERP